MVVIVPSSVMVTERSRKFTDCSGSSVFENSHIWLRPSLSWQRTSMKNCRSSFMISPSLMSMKLRLQIQR